MGVKMYLAMVVSVLVFVFAPLARTQSLAHSPISNEVPLLEGVGTAESPSSEATLVQSVGERDAYEAQVSCETIEDAVHALATEPFSRLYSAVLQAEQNLTPEPWTVLTGLSADPRVLKVLNLARNAETDEKARMLKCVVPELERILMASPAPGRAHPLIRFSGHLLLPVVLAHVDEKGETLSLLARILVKLQELSTVNLSRGLATIDWSQFKEVLPGGLPPKSAPCYVNSRMSDFALFAARRILDRVGDQSATEARLTEDQRRTLLQYLEFRQCVRGEMRASAGEPSSEQADLQAWSEAVHTLAAKHVLGENDDPNRVLFSFIRDFAGM